MAIDGLDFYGAWEGAASPTPSSSAEAAYGAAGDSGPSPLLSALNPFHAFGLTFWTGVTAVVILTALYFVLPARRG